MPRHGQYGGAPLSRTRIPVPDDLEGDARALFLTLVASAKPEHFTPLDAPLLASYVRACITERDAAAMIAADIMGASKTVLDVQRTSAAIMTRLAVRLRVSPQGRAPTVTRPAQFAAGNGGSYYDRMELVDGSD